MIDDATRSPQPQQNHANPERPGDVGLHRGFLEDLTEWVGRFQPDGTILYVNDAYCRFFGKTAAELIGSRWQPVAVEEDLPHIERQLRSLSPSNPVVTIENRVVGADGAIHWGQFVNRAFFNSQGQLVTLQAVGRDITAQKSRELEMQKMAIEQQAILDNPMLGIFKVSRRVTVWANQAFAAMLGYTVEEVIGQPTRVRYVSDADYEQFSRDAFPVLAKGETFHTQLQQRARNGTVGWYEFTVRMLDAGTATLIGTMVDITRRKAAEAELARHRDSLEAMVAQRTAALIEARDHADAAHVQAAHALADAAASHARLQAALNAMSDAVFISDLEGRFIHFNAAFASFHRFASVEECARTLQEYPAFLDVYAPDGELLPLQRWAVPRALRGETAVNAEFTLRRRDTGDTWVGSYNLAPVREADGRIIGSVVTARDITAQKNVEIRLQQAQDAAQAGLRAKSVFLSTMSHEIRTPMNAIVGMGQMMHRQTTDPRQRRQLDVVLSASARLLSLVDALLDLARIQSGNLVLEDQPFTLDGVLTHALALGRARLGQRPLTLDLSLDDTLQGLRLCGDATRLTQILLNLIDNAIKFSEQGPILLACHALADSGGAVDLRFEVRDPGCGVAPADRSRIFLLEQADGSATRRHGGSGLGLAISKGLVERMGGSIGVDSEAGAGSVFWFTVRLQRMGTAG